MDLKEKKLNSKLIYEGKVVTLYKDDVLCPNGNHYFLKIKCIPRNYVYLYLSVFSMFFLIVFIVSSFF